MKLNVLSKTEIEQFMELGWIRLEEAIPRKQALAAADFLWDKVEEQGAIRHDPATWTKPMIRLNEDYDTPEFRACNTERLWGAIEDLIGADRAINRANAGWGYWVMNFSVGANRPWSLPTGGWHQDGSHFRHFIDSGDQGLLQLAFFSEVGSHGGAPLVIEGSHNVVARVLKQHPEGLDVFDAMRLEFQHPWIAGITDPPVDESRSAEEVAQDRIERYMNADYTDPEGYRMKVVEATGTVGDVILAHPFLIHNSSQNHLGIPRFLMTKTVPLKERMNLNRPDAADYSPLELSTVRAMG
ncbi:hypothetical protein GZH47_20450 [Paenibacillus rhizovicinus]|uniref:Phytanoyl-CoA dioxygenase family protein n=1 Tax=Paenibacillus rhizovicinus TaxID=2704463 RepID=A0A6C0P3L5_9BACL|nr:hypothetical protein [Paenibacillus rhizovicinus]QHW32931.1 hypothetical protein GZH47_20450 [Paenibacillus rhizovicinus]